MHRMIPAGRHGVSVGRRRLRDPDDLPCIVKQGPSETGQVSSAWPDCRRSLPDNLKTLNNYQCHGSCCHNVAILNYASKWFWSLFRPASLLKVSLKIRPGV